MSYRTRCLHVVYFAFKLNIFSFYRYVLASDFFKMIKRGFNVQCAVEIHIKSSAVSTFSSLIWYVEDFRWRFYEVYSLFWSFCAWKDFELWCHLKVLSLLIASSCVQHSGHSRVLSHFNLASLFANRKPSEGFCYNESLSFYLIKGQYYAVKNLAYSFFNC